MVSVMKDLFGKLMAASESAEGNPALDFSNDENTEAQTGSSLNTLLDLVNTYFSLMPADEAEEKAMDHDCGTSAKVYIRRLRHLLVVMGLL